MRRNCKYLLFGSGRRSLLLPVILKKWLTLLLPGSHRPGLNVRDVIGEAGNARRRYA